MNRILNLLFCCFLFLSTLDGKPEPEQVVILGSGPAGLSAAIYASRAGISPLIIEGGEPGGQIALSHLVENFPGFPKGINGDELGKNMREQALRFGARIINESVEAVDLSKRPFKITLDDETVIYTHSLIIATGASSKWLGLPSEKALIGKGVSSCAVCDAFFYKDKEVVVVGGGDTALEDALYLTNFASKVTIVHRRDSFKASKYLQNKVFGNNKIQVIWNSVLEEIKDLQQDRVTAVTLKDVKANQSRQYPCQGVFIAIGHQPNTRLFAGQLELNDSGYIVTKQMSTKTSISGVFAAGDVADPHYRQAITAAGTGCMAGIDAYHFINQLDP